MTKFDFLIADMEHGPFNIETIHQFVSLLESKDITPIVRVPKLDESYILRILETGVSAIQVSHISNKEEALKFVQYAKYPPIGNRGLSPVSRAAKYDYSGETTISDICSELEQGKIVIIDTSSFSGSVEILIGSMISTEIFEKYKYYKSKSQDQLEYKPVISIVLEEAPRVLGKEILDRGNNIFSTIAREGRKFKIGLTAITQLPSLIPRQILANMNTKIILGIEMAPERQAIIESASQDLSSDNRTIASLDVGEAIVTSNFSKFALPIKVPLFDDVVRGALEKAKEEKSQDRKTFKEDFAGVKTD